MLNSRSGYRKTIMMLLTVCTVGILFWPSTGVSLGTAPPLPFEQDSEHHRLSDGSDSALTIQLLPSNPSDTKRSLHRAADLLKQAADVLSKNERLAMTYIRESISILRHDVIGTPIVPQADRVSETSFPIFYDPRPCPIREPGCSYESITPWFDLRAEERAD